MEELQKKIDTYNSEIKILKEEKRKAISEGKGLKEIRSFNGLLKSLIRLRDLEQDKLDKLI